jgi:penicillin-insensitive murein endopeptidase
MRITRRRFYGHPRLLDTLRDVASSLHERKGVTLLLGDLSMPRGGPMTGAHGSHQTGLDADVWFSVAEEYGAGRPFTLDDRENLPARKFGEGNVDATRSEMIRLFASHPSVDRLFVSPGIKRGLCRSFPGADDAPWLRKVRPWWGHEDHLHLRVACPPASPSCDGGKEIPPGNGCDSTLDWWFGAEAKAKGEAAVPPEEPILPEACRAVAEAPPWE